MKRTTPLVMAAGVALLVSATAACTQQSTKTSASATGGGATAAATAVPAAEVTVPPDMPAKIKGKKLRIALVRQSGVGDYFEQWGNGAKKQADAFGAQVTVYDARADNAKQATMMTDAINAKPDVIIVDHGLADTVNPKIDQAIAAGIPVVIYDVVVPNPKATVLQQSDRKLAELSVGQLAKDTGGTAKVAYVNVPGIAPLDRRDTYWQEFKKQHPSIQEVGKFGKYTESTAADTAAEGDAFFKAHPDVTAVFAAYDELVKGTLIALRNNGLTGKVKVYGIDISTADIQLMTAPGSAWKATATTDPASTGAIVMRAAILKAAEVALPHVVEIPGVLLTQDQLRQANVRNMDDLRKAVPDLNNSKLLAAGWLSAVTF